MYDWRITFLIYGFESDSTSSGKTLSGYRLFKIFDLIFPLFVEKIFGLLDCKLKFLLNFLLSFAFINTLFQLIRFEYQLICFKSQLLLEKTDFLLKFVYGRDGHVWTVHFLFISVNLLSSELKLSLSLLKLLF